MAFGTGTHPTTQLCLSLVEDYFTQSENRQGLRVIDIGCGSGILSIAALKLGAEKALGLDIDPEAIQASRDNAVINGVMNQLELGIGSVTELIAGKFGIQMAQLVLANILAPVLVQLLDQGLGELVMPEGWLILSGILEEQSTEVESALQSFGFHLVRKSQMGDWIALAAQR
jgi:ribosomal protein L11 methyltransferase